MERQPWCRGGAGHPHADPSSCSCPLDLSALTPPTPQQGTRGDVVSDAVNKAATTAGLHAFFSAAGDICAVPFSIQEAGCAMMRVMLVML